MRKLRNFYEKVTYLLYESHVFTTRKSPVYLKELTCFLTAGKQILPVSITHDILSLLMSDALFMLFHYSLIGINALVVLKHERVRTKFVDTEGV